MPDNQAVRAVTCPSCGASVHAAEGQYRTTCEYCGALLELPHPSMPEARPTIIAGPTHLPPKSGKTQSGGWGWMVVVLAVLMLAGVGLVSYVIVRGLDKANLPSLSSVMTSLRVSVPALIVSDADSLDPDAVVYSYDYAKDTHFLGYFDGSTRALRWQTAPLGDDSYRAALAGNDKLVYAAVKTSVMAIDRETGQTAWEASVSDELPYGCPSDCLRLMGQRVIVMARDGRLYGLDAQTGRIVWNIQLNKTPDDLYAVGKLIAVLDDRDGSGIVSIIDPVDGSELHVLEPQCTDSESGFTDDPDLNDPILEVPGQNSLVILFGFFSSCVQRWDVTAGKMLWNASLVDVSFSHAFGPSSNLNANSVFVASENQLLEIALADGRWRSVIENPDYEFVPLAERDGVLIVRAKRTRGTTRFELWGVSASTGELLWTHPFSDSEPLDEPDRMVGLVDKGDSAWTAHLTSAGLVVVQAMAEPHQLTVEVLDPATGASGGPAVIAMPGISGDFYGVPDVVSWRQDQLWLMVEGRMYVVNLTEGSLRFAWP